MPELLVVRPGAIGDALLACPALAALRVARPDDRLTYISHPAVGDLLLAHGLIDRFISRDDPAADALFAPTPRLAHAHFGSIAAAVAWTTDPSGRVAANLASLGADPLIVAPSRPADASTKHVAEHLLDSLAPLAHALFDPDWSPLCRPPRDHRAAVTADGPPLVLLHVGSGSVRKNWPAEGFAAVADALWQQLRIELRILVGPADEEQFASFQCAVAAPHAVLSERPLLELADLLTRCDLYLGNDSGISHLAGLCGAPTLAIFGLTDPRRWRPIGPRVRVLRGGETLETLAAAAVLDAALSLLAGRAA